MDILPSSPKSLQLLCPVIRRRKTMRRLKCAARMCRFPSRLRHRLLRCLLLVVTPIRRPQLRLLIRPHLKCGLMTF